MKKVLILLSVFALLTQNGFSQTTNNKKLKENLQELKNDYSFLENYKTMQVPYIDSTNFDNHKVSNLLSAKQIELLKLTKVYGKEYIEFDQTKIGINYILNLSEDYTTIAIFFYFTEMELSSTLINYDIEFNIIDFKTVAMDEIAESIFRTESIIEKNKILITNFKFFNETIEEKVIIEITDDGKFKTRR